MCACASQQPGSCEPAACSEPELYFDHKAGDVTDRARACALFLPWVRRIKKKKNNNTHLWVCTRTTQKVIDNTYVSRVCEETEKVFKQTDLALTRTHFSVLCEGTVRSCVLWWLLRASIEHLTPEYSVCIHNTQDGVKQEENSLLNCSINTGEINTIYMNTIFMVFLFIYLHWDFPLATRLDFPFSTLPGTLRNLQLCLFSTKKMIHSEAESQMVP